MDAPSNEGAGVSEATSDSAGESEPPPPASAAAKTAMQTNASVASRANLLGLAFMSSLNLFSCHARAWRGRAALWFRRALRAKAARRGRRSYKTGFAALAAGGGGTQIAPGAIALAPRRNQRSRRTCANERRRRASRCEKKRVWGGRGTASGAKPSREFRERG